MREGRGRCSMNVRRWQLRESDPGGVADCCEGVFGCRQMEQFTCSTNLWSNQAGPPILWFDRRERDIYKQGIAEAPETWVLRSSKRQACLGVWLK